MWAVMYQGNMAELARRQRQLVDLARQNDDRFAELNFGTAVATTALLAADDSAEARRRLAEENDRLLMPGRFFVQHHNWLLASALLELYDGDGAAAWRIIAEGWRKYSSSLLSYVQQVRIDFFSTYGRAALAAAAAGGDRKVLLARAAAAASRLERENARWATAMAKMLRASVAHQTRDPRAAIDCLTAAAATFRAVPMHLYAAAVDWQLGNLQEGAAAADLSRRAEDEMRALGVQNPARMAGALVTGLVRP